MTSLHIINELYSTDPQAAIDQLYIQATSYNNLFGGIKHRWEFADGDRAHMTCSIDGSHVVLWSGPEPIDAWHLPKGAGPSEDIYGDGRYKKQEPRPLYMAPPKERKNDTSTGTMFNLYSRGVATSNDAALYSFDRGSEGTMFDVYSSGVKTSNDAALYSPSKNGLFGRVKVMIEIYNLSRAAVGLGFLSAEEAGSNRGYPQRNAVDNLTAEQLSDCYGWLIAEQRQILEERTIQPRML